MVIIIQDKRIQELWRQQINCDSYKYSDHTKQRTVFITHRFEEKMSRMA